MWLLLLAAAMFAWMIPLWLTVTPPDPDHEPARLEGERIVVRAEPWFGRSGSGWVAFGVAVLALALSSIALVVVTFAIGIADNVVSRLEHRITTIVLDNDALDVVSPWFTRTRTKRFALRDITSVEIKIDGGGSERSTGNYVMRSLRIVLADGTRHRVPLPMYDGFDEWFTDELRRRIAAAAAIAPDEAALEALVDALANPGASSLYRGENHRTVIDSDRRGVVREGPDRRLAIRLERERNDLVVTLHLNERVATRRYATTPSLDDLEGWIAIEEDRGAEPGPNLTGAKPGRGLT